MYPVTESTFCHRLSMAVATHGTSLSIRGIRLVLITTVRTAIPAATPFVRCLLSSFFIPLPTTQLSISPLEGSGVENTKKSLLNLLSRSDFFSLVAYSALSTSGSLTISDAASSSSATLSPKTSEPVSSSNSSSSPSSASNLVTDTTRSLSAVRNKITP